MIVTNVAITTIKQGIRTVSGITFLSREINRFAKISTAVVERPMPIPLIAEDVTARVGHIPIT